MIGVTLVQDEGMYFIASTANTNLLIDQPIDSCWLPRWNLINTSYLHNNILQLILFVWGPTNKESICDG